MDWVRPGLILLLAGVAGVAYLWLSAKHKRSLSPRSPPKVVQDHNANKLSPVKETHDRQPLEILYPGPTESTSDDAEVDIIAVHGLGSNVDWSWTWKDGEKRINWLQDPNMLPDKVPKSRIMVYNYDSRWHESAPKTRLQLCGEELVHCIQSFHGGASKRPIVFIGHSLGGNVIMHALLDANDKDKYKYLLDLTVGVVFLGTPLRGTKWQPFIDSLAQLMGPAGSHRGITKELGFDDPGLQDKLHRFCQLRNRLSTPVACFSELYETDYGRRFGISGVAKGMVVEEASACIPGLDRYALQTDHLKINKYCSPTDRSFVRVSDVVFRMCSNAKDIIRRRQYPREIVTGNTYALKQKPDAGDCLRDLFLTDPLEQRTGLKRKKGDRSRGTCEWIFGTEELTAWLDSSQAGHPDDQATHILWLYGNPGTGKSTMAITLTEVLSTAFSTTDGKTLAYFFCDSGFDTQKTATSIIRGLLLQLVRQHPQLLDYLLPKYHERGVELFKSFDALWLIFMDVVADRNTGRKYCIIDALDECDKESQKILLQQFQQTFRDQNATSNIRILITSRPYDEIREYMGDFANKDLASFSEVQQDIDRCIEERTAELARRKGYTGKVKKQVADILRGKADNTFLWVGLACKELEDVLSQDAVRVLQDMPKGLHSLYKKLLDTAFLQSDQIDKVRRVLSFVSACVRPLTILELSEACQLHQQEEDEETRIQFMREQIASCRLMVVIQDEKVVLLHQSVRDFLAEAGTGHFDKLEAHAHIAYRCVDLLIEQFHNRNQSHVDFSRYAILNWADHARMAQSKFQIKDSQAEFFKVHSPCREYWLYSHRHLALSFGTLPERSSILHVAARWGIKVLVDYVSHSDDQYHKAGEINRFVECINGDGETPLECAAKSGYSSVVSLLLELGGKVTASVAQKAAGSLKNSEELITLLLDEQGDQIITTEEVLKAAAGNTQNGKETMILLLDRRGDQIVITEEVLKAAAGNGKGGKEVMKLLLDRRGDEVIITEEVVKAAAGNEWAGQNVMTLLLDRRGDEVIITEEVVKAAAGNEWAGQNVMTLLLDRRGDEVIITEEVVKAAAGNKWAGKEVITLLLDRRGEEVIITEEVVKAAVGNEWAGKEVMILLLDQRGDQIIITEEVLKAAAGNREGGKEVMELLLDQRGDQIIITEEVLKVAAGNNDGGEEVMILLLDERGDEVIITEEVVKAAAGNKWAGKEVITLLLDRRGEEVIITEEVVKAAVGNEWAGKEVMILLLDQRGDQIIITEEVLKAAAGNNDGGEEVMILLLDERGDEVIITEEVVKAAAGNEWAGKEVITLLLDRRGEEVIITEEVVKAAAGNELAGKEVMTLLLDRRGDEVIITEEVVKAAAGNEGTGKEIMKLLLDRRGDEIVITEEVVKVAAGNELAGKEVITLLLNRRGEEVIITEEVVKAAAGNELAGKEVMTLLLDRRGDEVIITEEVVRAAAGNEWAGKEVMTLLLDRRGDKVIITKEVVKAAAGNERAGKKVMTLLLDRRGDEIIITEEVVKAAAGNELAGKEVMTLLLDRREDEIIITKEVVKAAAGNELAGKEVITLLLNRRGDEVIITEEVVKAAAGNEGTGKEIMKLLLDWRGDEIVITEEVVKEAVGNYWNGKEVMTLLLDRRGDEVTITEEVVKAAAGNEGTGKEVMTLLLGRRGDEVIITEEVVNAAVTCGQDGVLNLLSQNSLICDHKEGWRDIAKFYNAAKAGNVSSIKQLLDAGTEPDVKNVRGVTPLWIAATFERNAVVQVLAQRTDVNVNSRSTAGRSPLFWPSCRGYKQVVAILMEAGADASFVDENGDTAITAARRNGHTKVADMLELSIEQA